MEKRWNRSWRSVRDSSEQPKKDQTLENDRQILREQLEQYRGRLPRDYCSR